MAAQGLQLPISIQIQNLQDVAAQLKKLASSNVLSDSLGGKKIDAELTKVLHTLAQIELRSKNAFKTEGDFSSLEKDINKVELSIDRIKTGFSGLKFDELKIPTDVQDQLTALNAQIAALKNNFSAFKAAQKDKLLENVDFTGNLSKAFGKDAAGMMTKNYDEMYAAIERGMARINAKLLAAKAEFQMNSQLVTQNAPGKAKFSAWGALDFLEQAFKSLPTDQSKYTKQQEMLAKYMQIGTINSETGEQGFTKFNNGGAATQFFHQLAQMYELTPAQLEEIRKRVTEAAKNANTTAGEALRAAATDRAKGAEIFGGKGMSYDALLAGKQQYESQVKTAQDSGVHVDQVQAQVDAVSAAWRSLQAVQEEVAASQRVLDDALKAPTASLTELQNAVVSSVANMPQLGQAFSQAAAQIYQLRQAADAGRAQLVSLDQTLGKLQGVSNFVNRYVGIYAIVRKVSQAVRNAFQNIKDLDKNITNIAVVTNMSQEDLWGKIGEYTEMAQQYGVATKDVYTVSQLFYQQGLQTNQVMSLTTETLKMAKISGMGYEEAANAMTVAIRAFRIEMTDAQSVTDTYSALAAKFAVSSQEIANAMEKTASSAANVGMSLESTSAFISVMTQTTRESAQNIGSALKSIISRYGEMKASPTSLLNVDGEDVAFNKVDTALKSVGISIKDASGQFRDFDDVIMELAAKWDTLDNNTQRYIATVMAGNRQQSRFIALVSNYDELSRAMDTANNSQNASIVQTAKTMDSLESKAQQLKNAFSQVYLDLHIEDGLKSAYDWLTRILKTVGKLGVLKGVLPTLANVIGIGTGTKKLVNYAKEGVMDHRRNLEKTVNLKDEEAKQKAQELQAMLEKEANKKVTIQADLSQLQSAQASVEASVNATGMKAANMLVGMGAGRNGMTYTPTEMMGIMGRAQEKGLFSTPEGREKFLTHMGVDPNSESGGQLNALLESFNTLAGQAAQLGVALQGATNSANNAAGADDKKTGSAEGAANADERKTRAAEGATGADDKKTGSAEGAAQADQEKITPAKGAALGDQGKIVPAAGAALVDGKKTVEGEQAAGADERKVPAAEGAAQSDRDKVGPAEAAAAADRLKAQGGAPTGGTPTGGKVPPGNNTPTTKTSPWEGHETAMKVVGVASGVARLAGTAITAAGAAHQDKSTDTVETSKILTGIGNGLSMAGTGASMGMAFGPWGAAIGAIGGFLVGGLGAIIDGAEMTLAEKVALMKEEYAKANEESLKKQAETTDLSSQIDNLKQLKNVMYNSTEDLQAYKDAMNTMADQYPNLVSSYDEAGNAIIDLNDAEQSLAAVRLEGARAAREAAIKEGELYSGYAEALRDAMGQVTAMEGTTGTTVYSYGSWGIKEKEDKLEGRSVATEVEGQKKEIVTSLERDVSQGQTYASIKTYDFLSALKEAAPKVFPERDFDSLKFEEIQQVVQALIENPELGGTGHYKYNGSNPNPGAGDKGTMIPTEMWEEYAEGMEGTSAITMTYDTSALDKTIEQWKDLFGGKTTARQLIGVDNEETPITIAELIDIESAIERVIGKNDATLETIRKQTNFALNQESFFTAANNNTSLSTSELMSLQGNTIYSRLFSQAMQAHISAEGKYTDALEWYNSKDQKGYLTEANFVAQDFITWYETLTDAQRQVLESLDFTQYTSVDAMLAAAGIHLDQESDIYKGFERQFIESNKANRDRILKALYTYDADTKTWSFNTKDFKGLANLVHGSEYAGEITNNFQDLIQDGEHIGAQIISKYADYFTTQLVNINKLAESGQTELASRRLTTLKGLSDALSEIDDDAVQNDLYGTITSIDFSSYESIVKAYNAIESYGKTHNVDVSPILNELTAAEENLVFNVTTLASELTTQITNAAKDMDTILSTNKSGLTLDKAIEAFDKLASAFSELTNFDEVFTYDAALNKYVYTAEGLEKAIAAKEQELAEQAKMLSDTAQIYSEQLTMTTIDKQGNSYKQAALRMYSPKTNYQTASGAVDTTTINGLRYQLEHGHTSGDEYMMHPYETRAEIEEALLKHWGIDANDAGIKAILDEQEKTGKFTLQGVRDTYLAKHKDGAYGYASEIMQDVKGFIGGDNNLLPYYETLAKGFMDSTDEKYKDKTWDNFLMYLEAEAQSNSEKAEDAQALLAEYQKNKKNQLYAAIDWNKLVTGSDYTGTNKQLTESLAKEVGLLVKRVDESGKAVLDEAGHEIWDRVEGYQGTWQEVQDAYLDQIYGSEEEINAITDEAERAQKRAAKDAAKAAIKGAQKQAKSNQITTAISEILAGEGKVLTDTTIALMNQTEGLNISAADGVLAAGQDYVTAALALYEAHKDNLLSVAERNTAYASIITKKFAKSNQLITTLSSGTSLDIDALSTAFTTFGVELSDYYDASAENVQQAWMKKVKLEGGAEINNPFAGALETDIYGKTRITDWNKFVQGLGTQVDLSQYTGTFEYQNAYSSYVDGLITLQTQGTDLVKKQYDNAFSSITKYKQLNVSQMDQVDSLKLAAGGAGTLENGILKITDTVQYARNAIGLFSDLSLLSDEQLYDQTGWTSTDLAKNWKAARTILTQASDSWTSISENIMSLTDDNISTLMEKGGLKLSELNDIFTKVNDKYVINLTKYEEQLKKTIGEGKDVLTPAQQKKVDDAMISARAAIANKLTGVSWDKILNKTATEADWATFQDTMASSLAAMGLRLEDYYSWGVGSNVTLDLTSLRSAVESTNSEIGKQFNESLDKTIASLKDTGLSEISTAMEYTISGTDNQTAMREFAKRYKELTGVTKSLDQLFTYDANLQKYTLNVEDLKTYQDAQKTYLESLGISSTAIDQYIKDQTQQLLTAEMDISGFVTGKDLSATSKEAQTLMSQLKTWAMSFYGQLPDAATIDSWMKTLIGGGDNAVELLKRIKGEKNVTADEITAVYTAATTRLKDSLELMSSKAGTIVDSYTASLFQNAGATITDLGNGQYVIASIPNENWGAKIAAAYKQLYESLKTSAGATVTDLNNAYAKILESAESEQSNPIEAIANATSMTYTQLGEILAKEGIKLEDVIADQAKYGIESLGAGKIRIKDFTTFAEQMGWDTDTEEYVTAFKTYNDSLTELNRKTEKSILEEVKGLGDIKAGDKINLTTLWTKIQKGIKAKLESEDPEDYMAQAESEVGANSVEARYVAEAYAAAAKERNESYSKTLEAELAVYGATFKDGILTIGANADIQGIITKISSLAAENTSLLPNELAELADAIDEYISNLTSLIKSGLSGSLTNSNAQSLQAWADSQDLGKLDFTRTADGLKLSTQSAIELYNALKQIDALQAQLVFKELNSSLKETNENYKSVTSTMGRIKTLQGKIEELTAARSGLNAEDQKRTDAKINQYKEELALAKEILAARSTAEDDSFNFMSGKIPGAQNNPLNYAKNWTQALQTIRDAFSTGPKKAGKRGFIDYQDWYNIATEINNMAATTGQEIKIGSLTFKGDLESAAAAIQAGAESLTTVDTGDLKVNLASVGIGIKSGADALTSGITEGIQGVAKAQVKALDGLIAMLELIVSMEALGDIDVDSNGIDLSELFTVTTNEGTEVKQFNEAYAKWRKTMIDQLKLKKGQDGYNEDLQNALKGIKIGELSLADIIQWDEAKLLGADESVQKAYMAILSAFSKAAQSGNYDLDNIQESVLSVLSESGLTEAITLDIGDTTLIVTGGRISQVDWQAADAQEILKLIDSDLTEARKTATELISKYVSNQPLTTQELTYVLALQGNVTLENGEITSVTVGGHTYTDKSQFTAAMRAQVLEDQGVKVTQEEIEAAAKVDGGTVSTTVNMGKHTDIKVTSGEDGVEWWDGENGPYKSKQAMLDAAWEIFDAEQKKHEDQPQKTKDEYLYDEWNIRKKVTAKVTSGDEEITIDNDPAARAAIRNKIQQALTEEYQFNSEGNLDIDLGNGMKVTLSGDAVVSADGVTVDNNKVVAELQKMLGMDSALVDNISTAIGQAFQNAEIGSTLGTAIAAALTDSGIPLDNLTITPENISVDGNTVTLTAPIEEATGTVTTLKITATNTQADGGISNADIKLQLADAEVAVTIDKDGAVKDLETIASKIKEVDGTDPKISVTADTSKASLQLQNIINKLSNIVSKSITITTTYKENGTPPSTGDQATGNIGLASGNAFAQGTLMGELGPELVVSNGRYFVVGQQGPEMVNLAKDAIVFNHLQTKSLLEKGTSPDRGRAITNERNAVAFATGSRNGGPAMASAAAALAALKQLRAQWKALESLSAKDLAGKAGGGGGGGGKNAAFIKELERWYNLLQDIATLEQKITYEQNKRSKIQSSFNKSGKEYFASQKESLKDLEKEVQKHQQLADEQQKYFDKRRAELNKQSAFSELYTFDENGQIKYKEGKFEELSQMFGGDSTTGKPNHSVKEQYDWLISQGYGYAMEYNENGEKIEIKDAKDEAGMKSAIEAFWAKIDSDKSEMQELHDSIEEHKNAVLEKQQAQNELLKEIEDNQLAVEQKVLKAVEDAAKREIDELQDQKDAIQKGNEALISGLSEQLNKERQMYQNQESFNELESKRRRLAILQRSGGSASEIASLQKEIDTSAREEYFNKQQEQIDAIQEASDNELEKLQKQIDIMNETLEYQKENGLLWAQVYEVMAKSPEEIADYIKANDSSYWGKSPADLARSMRDDLFEAEKWAAFAAEGVDIKDYVAKIAEEVTQEESNNNNNNNNNSNDNGKTDNATSNTSDSGDTNNNNNNNNSDNQPNKPTTYKYKQKATLRYVDDQYHTWIATGKGQSNKSVEDAQAKARSNALAVAKKTGRYRAAGNTTYEAYSEGGYDYQTGLAVLHGTPTKPEAVFNAEQTKILRDNILSNKPESLINLLKTYNEAYHGLSSSTYDSIADNSNSIVIEKAEVNMNVAKMNDKYDAKQAGKDVMRELLAISNKTEVRNKVTT